MGYVINTKQFRLCKGALKQEKRFLKYIGVDEWCWFTWLEVSTISRVTGHRFRGLFRHEMLFSLTWSRLIYLQGRLHRLAPRCPPASSRRSKEDPRVPLPSREGNRTLLYGVDTRRNSRVRPERLSQLMSC